MEAPYVEMVLENIQPIDPDVILEDEDVVQAFAKGVDREQLKEELNKNYQLIHGRCCTLCERSVVDSKAAIVIVNGLGVEALFCSPACAEDIIMVRALQTTHNGIIDSINIRSQVPFTGPPDEEGEEDDSANEG